MKLQHSILQRRRLRWGFSLASIVALGTTNVLSAQPDDLDEDVYTLSPFEIQTSERDIGYYTENTLAGSRLNTRISDLAASISVITRQQMDDTASVDLNDVFRYELNTEGAGTYTPSVQSLRNDGVVDTIGGYTHGGSGSPQTVATANRIRGLGVPDRTINYYLSVPNVPMDSYNVQSLEINRGPNSMIFGLGSPAGIVNINTSSAIIGEQMLNLSMRFDDRGSHRASLSFNYPVLDNLAVAGALLYSDQQFKRKPSYDRTERVYGAITYRPWERARIRFNIEHYDNENRRPNNLTPRDGVTPWRLAGMPVYNPSNLTVSKLTTGEVVGPMVMRADSLRADQVRDFVMARPGYDATLWNADQTQYAGFTIFGEGVLTNTNSSFYTPGLSWANNGRPTMQIADGQLVNWFTGFAGQYRRVFGTPDNPAANAPLMPPVADIVANPDSDQVFNQRWSRSELWGAPEGVGSYRYPGVTNREIYDWRRINVNQMNFGKDKNLTMNLEFDAEIIRDLLHVNAGWFRQDFESTTNYTVAQLNVTTLWVDTNVTLPDGRPNPYLGLPYVEDFDPDQFVNDTETDQFRAMIAFTPDFTNNDGWTRWLGRHNIMGMASRFDSKHTFVRNRWFFLGGDEVANGTIRWLKNPNNDAAGNPTGWDYANTSARRTFYLATPGDMFGKVTTAPGTFNHQQVTGNVHTFNYDTNGWENVRMTQGFYPWEATTARNQRRVDTFKAGITSYLWDDRIITTFGVSRDEYQARATTLGAITHPDGSVTPGMTNPEKYVNGHFQLDEALSRWNVWDELTGTTTTAGVVFMPFKNYQSIEDAANGGSLWNQFLRGFGLHYNSSDNFNPPTAAQVDAFGVTLPKPTGKGKDYGFQFSLFDEKLYARVTWFEASNENERTNPGTSISRLVNQVDTNLFRGWARTIALINTGRDPTTQDWDVVSAEEEDAIQAATAAIWGMHYDYYADLPGQIYATRSAEAEGIEVQVTYNPLRNWTMKFTASKQETKYANVLKEFDEWHAFRSPSWDNARAADFLLPQYQHLAQYTMYTGREVNLTNFWESYGFHPDARLDNPWGNYNVALYYDDVVTPQYAIASDLEGQAAPGQRKYRWSYLTNYFFDGGPLEGFSVGGAVRWEDRAVIGYYGKPNQDPNMLSLSDVDRPIYDDARFYTDLWIGYTQRIMNDKVRMKLQLNVANAFEDGRLQTVAVNYDGSPNAFRIIDPRQFIFTASFDF